MVAAVRLIYGKVPKMRIWSVQGEGEIGGLFVLEGCEASV